MKILLDAHTLGSELGGNERYIRGLLAGFECIGAKESICLALSPGVFANRVKNLPGWMAESFSSDRRLIRLFSDFRRILASGEQDLLHVSGVAPPLGNSPTLVTVHDLLFEDFPTYFPVSQVIAFKAAFRLSVARAAHVITVSEYTRDRLLTLYRVPPEKLTVTHLGVGEEFHPRSPGEVEAVRHKYGISGPYVLIVGNLHPRKNISRMGQAFLRLSNLPQFSTHQLVLVGKKTWKADAMLKPLAPLLDQNRAILTGYVPDEELPALYTGARLFAYPSLFEGFGIPPLEAMACGTPVLVGRTTSLPEVCGDAAHWVDPFSVESLFQGLIALLESDFYHAEMSNRAVIQAARFTWASTAEKTWMAYARALQSRP